MCINPRIFMYNIFLLINIYICFIRLHLRKIIGNKKVKLHGISEHKLFYLKVIFLPESLLRSDDILTLQTNLQMRLGTRLFGWVRSRVMVRQKALRKQFLHPCAHQCQGQGTTYQLVLRVPQVTILQIQDLLHLTQQLTTATD